MSRWPVAANPIGRTPELDGIRGLAILMVVVWHYLTCQLGAIEPGSLVAYVYMATSLFWTGVDLFFVLSGFLIGGILFEQREAHHLFSVFFLRRACRILAAYGLFLAFFLAVKTSVQPGSFPWLFEDPLPFWSYLTFTQNILMGIRNSTGGNFLGITWSLAVEEQFYVCAPLLVLLLKSRHRLWGLFTLMLIAILLRVGFPGEHTFFITPFRMDGLLLGVVLAILTRHEKSMVFLTLHKRAVALGFALLASTFVWLTVHWTALGTFRETFFALLYATLILAVLLHRDEKGTRWLRNPALQFLGVISYGLYLYHQACLGMVHGTLFGGKPQLTSPTAILATIGALALAILAASVSHFTLEKYFLRLGRKRSFGSDSIPRP